jgi:5-bromo-4-chloroindolyl phosphate hydrolysis protein
MEVLASFLSHTDVLLAVVVFGIVVSILLMKRIIALAIKFLLFSAKLAFVAILGLSIYSQSSPPPETSSALGLSLEQIGDTLINQIATIRKELTIETSQSNPRF